MILWLYCYLSKQNSIHNCITYWVQTYSRCDITQMNTITKNRWTILVQNTVFLYEFTETQRKHKTIIMKHNKYLEYFRFHKILWVVSLKYPLFMKSKKFSASWSCYILIAVTAQNIYPYIWLEFLFFDKLNQCNYLFDRHKVRQGETSTRHNLHASINLSKNLYNPTDGSNSMWVFDQRL